MEILQLRNKIMLTEKLSFENEKLKKELEEIKVENDYLIKENQNVDSIVEVYEEILARYKKLLEKHAIEISDLKADIIKKDNFIEFQSQYIFNNIDN